MPQTFFSNTIDLSELRRGDHIYCWSSILHHHHGIYVGKKKIIHVYGDRKRESEVQMATVQEFTRGRRLKRARYGRPSWELYVKAPGTVFNFPCDPQDKIVERAYAALGESPKTPDHLREIAEEKPWRYDLLFKNCENFCLQCTAPEHQQGSHQAKMLFFNPISTVVAGVRARLGEWGRNPKPPKPPGRRR